MSPGRHRAGWYWAPSSMQRICWGIVAGIALLFAGSGWFLAGLGKFGGAGATINWPGP